MLDIKKVIVLIIFSFAGVLQTTHVLAGTGPKTISGLEVTASGTEIRLSGFNGACTSLIENNVHKTWVRIGVNDVNQAQFVSVLLMAFASGKQINVYCGSSADWTNANNIVVEP